MPLSPKVLLAVALVVAVLGAAGWLYGAGRDAEKATTITNTLTAVERRNEIEREIARRPDGHAADRLRRDWARD